VNGMGLTTKLDINFASTSMILLGPFVDYYIGPDSGLHVQGSLGLGVLSLGEGTVTGMAVQPTPAQKGYGLAGMLGVGYEWRLSGVWSIGVLGRILAGRGSGDDTAGVKWTHTVFVPGLLATVTMN
jgi:hypothetical protein